MTTTAVFKTRAMPVTETPAASSRRAWGWFLMIVSCAMYAAIALLPFTSLSASAATITAGVLVILGEGAFIAGAALVGPELWATVKGWWGGTQGADASRSLWG